MIDGGAMIGRAASIACALAAGAVAGTLLGGCGVTRTVSVSGAPAPAIAGGRGAPRTTPTTAPSTTTSTTAAPSGGGASAPSAGGQSTSATRTAPSPAFVHTSAQSGEATANAQAGAAADIVTAHGYTPIDITEYHPDQTLRVLIGTRTGSAAEHTQHAFFFLDDRYIGTDTAQPSASIQVVSQSDTEVVLAYALYRPHDPLCCPSGGQATVRFQLNDGQLVPLGQIPPVSSATGLARQ
jgi:LppP/LprE lipoprotein